MASDEGLKYSLENRVAVITIDRPPLNVLPLDCLRRICGMAIDAVEMKEARAVIITGANGVFITGLDIKDISGLRTPQDNTNMTLEMKGLFRRVEELPRPVIAAIDGNCFGGGMELVLACHMRLVSETARLALPEINLGAFPSIGGTQRLPGLVGRPRALEIMLTGRQVMGEEAVRIGLANAVHPSSELVDKAKALALEIAGKNYQGVEAVMRCVGEGLDLGFEEGMIFETTLSSELIGTHNRKEGMAAFFERRKPAYQNE